VFPSGFSPTTGCARRCWCARPSFNPPLRGLWVCVEYDCNIHIEGTC
jgi:hypothetical protein